jgi:hypothetical protein
MKIPLKNGTEVEIDPKFYAEVCDLYWKDQVDVSIHKMRIWLLANPQKQGTLAGVNRRLMVFLKDCPLKPKIRQVVTPQPVKQETTLENRQSYLEKMRSMI